ncbi:hypothetical protein [Streptomyces yangpuensis]|uniref:hypothetical protein n=1 Tax=Streptomyces yangpuensis TaxID=1648182 RepID=UPI0037F38C20
MRPVVDVALAAVHVVAVVSVMRGGFKHHHLLAEARRHLAYVLRGRRHRPGLDEQIVQAAIDDYTRPVGRGRMMTADLRALYPHDTEDQAVLRANPQALRRTVRAGPSRRRGADRPHPHRTPRGPPELPAPAAHHHRADHAEPSPELAHGARAGRELEPTTDLAAVEQTSRTLETAAAEMAALLQAGIQKRAAARSSSLKSAAAPPPSAQQPVQPAPGRTPPTGGVA